jgi:bacteriorhodopsin
MPLLSAHGIDNAVTSLTASEAFVHYSLFVAMMALGAGFVFFLASKEKVLPEYRGTMVTSAMICGVAAVAYYFLTTQYGPGKPFPTDIRYVDWTVTTPLLLVKYPEMLRLRGFSFAWKLVLADLWMIVTGFIGELYGSTVNGHWTPNVPNGIADHYWWGAISTLGYLVILYYLLTEGNRYARTQPIPIQHGIKAMNLYIISLWGVYPITYWAEGLSATHLGINLDWFNVASSVADVINKFGFGLTAYFAVRALSGDDQEGTDRLPEDADTREGAAAPDAPARYVR